MNDTAICLALAVIIGCQVRKVIRLRRALTNFEPRPTIEDPFTGQRWTVDA